MSFTINNRRVSVSKCALQNKTLSDDTDEILRLQGVSWFTRKLIGLATITLIVNHYKDESGVEHIDIRSIGTGGFEGNFEQRALDWTAREVNDKVFGQVCASPFNS